MAKKKEEKSKVAEVESVEYSPPDEVSENQGEQPVQRPQRFSRGSKEATHDLVKLKVATMQKNVSWKYRRPDLVPVEHVHFFHSINDTTLQENKYCTPVGGHFHEVKLDWENLAPGGGPTVIVGPALHKVAKKIGNGEIRHRIVPVSFEDIGQGENDAGDILRRVDAHVHEGEYLGSETFTTNSRAAFIQNNKEQVKQSITGPVSLQPARQNAMVNSPEAQKVKHLMKEGTAKVEGA